MPRLSMTPTPDLAHLAQQSATCYPYNHSYNGSRSALYTFREYLVPDRSQGRLFTDMKYVMQFTGKVGYSHLNGDD
jgi:hypothetical protein